MKAIPQELAEKIDLYKSYLFDGDQRRIAKDTRKTEQMVSMVLNKKAKSLEILIAARTLAIKRANSLGVEIQ